MNQPFDRAIDTCKNSQCGNFMILAVTQILREINFEDSWSAKSAVLTNLQAVNFYFLQIWALFKGWNLSNERPYNGKTAVFALIDPRNWFHVKSEWQKTMKFLHCARKGIMSVIWRKIGNISWNRCSDLQISEKTFTNNNAVLKIFCQINFTKFLT